MNKDRMLQMAERNLKKARKALAINCSRQGITEEERNNLTDNVRFAEVVYDLIDSYAQ